MSTKSILKTSTEKTNLERRIKFKDQAKYNREDYEREDWKKEKERFDNVFNKLNIQAATEEFVST